MHPLAIEPLTQATTGLSRAPVGALVAAVGFVLLIACANVSNLLVCGPNAGGRNSGCNSPSAPRTAA